MKITKKLTLPSRDITRAKAKNLLIDNDIREAMNQLDNCKSINNSQLREYAKQLKGKDKNKLVEYVEILETYCELDKFISNKYNVKSVYCRSCKAGAGRMNCVKGKNKKRLQTDFEI